jgi:hypothetical protein
MGLQALEKKALSRGIIRKPACILAEITIRKSQDYFLAIKFQRNTTKADTIFEKR